MYWGIVQSIILVCGPSIDGSEILRCEGRGTDGSIPDMGIQNDGIMFVDARNGLKEGHDVWIGISIDGRDTNRH